MNMGTTAIPAPEYQADDSGGRPPMSRETLMLLIEATAMDMLLDLVTIAGGLHGVPPEAPVAPLVERAVEA